MNRAMPVQQRGLSLEGFIFGAFILVLLSIPLIKLIPSYIQAAQIKSTFNTIVRDPDMQKATPHDMKASFEKLAVMDNITAIKSEDIDISIEDGRPVLSASYVVKVPLVANISLYLEFNPTSAGK